MVTAIFAVLFSGMIWQLPYFIVILHNAWQGTDRHPLMLTHPGKRTIMSRHLDI